MRWRWLVAMLARIVFGLVFFLEGSQKIFGWWSGSPTGSGRPEPFMQWPYWWAGVVELAVGCLLIVGLFTRFAALVGAGTMAYAYFFVHLPLHWEPLQNGGAFAGTFCWGFLLLAVSEDTRFSLDCLILRSNRKGSLRSDHLGPETPHRRIADS
ncbi:DoxX family protein [Mycobacterium gordonae]|nr:DoxX family protein [Mycobacterium gordonae]MCQ4359715.1 DoxX family protein [Mycobacterium gordonae]